MNKYELCLVLKTNQDEDVVKAEFEKVIEMIGKFDGVVDKVDEWGKRKLAYEINKINEGVYYFINFSASNVVPSEIEKRLRISENVIRYLIIRLDA